MYIKKELEYFLNKYEDVCLKITGKLNFNLDVKQEQVEYNPKVPFSKHWENYNGIWLNLAPLEPSLFNESKSALKIIEAGYFNIPTLASDTFENRRFLNEGALLFKDPQEFYAKLEIMYDSAYYEQYCKNINENILKQADVVKESEKAVEFIEKITPGVVASDNRKRGVYTCHTLRLYYAAYLKNPTKRAYKEFCMFCRDLGYPLSLARYKKLQAYTKESSLIREYLGMPPSKNTLIKHIYSSQSLWLEEFSTYVKNKKVCIVGNAPLNKNMDFTKAIETYEIVIRFNNCCSNMNDTNRGKKVDIWMSAPDIKTSISALWNIVSGPNMIYKNANWKRFENTLENGGRILSTPLHIWKDMVQQLQAPPSAGILMIYWTHVIQNSFENITIVGFDIDNENKRYHHSDMNHQASSRHSWEKERELIKKWIAEDGLKRF